MAEPYRHDEQLADRLSELELAIADIHGASGSNGKLGNLRAEVATLRERVERGESRRWQLIVTLAGSALALIVSMVAMGRWAGSISADVETLKSYHRTHDRPEKP